MKRKYGDLIIGLIMVAVVIPPEEKLNRMLKNAEEDVAEAQLRVDLLSDSDSAKEVESAYRQLVKAQQKLIEAEEMLILEKEIL